MYKPQYRDVKCPQCDRTPLKGRIPTSWVKMPCKCPECGLFWRIAGRSWSWKPLWVPMKDQNR